MRSPRLVGSSVRFAATTLRLAMPPCLLASSTKASIAWPMSVRSPRANPPWSRPPTLAIRKPILTVVGVTPRSLAVSGPAVWPVAPVVPPAAVAAVVPPAPGAAAAPPVVGALTTAAAPDVPPATGAVPVPPSGVAGASAPWPVLVAAPAPAATLVDARWWPPVVSASTSSTTTPARATAVTPTCVFEACRNHRRICIPGVICAPRRPSICGRASAGTLDGGGVGAQVAGDHPRVGAYLLGRALGDHRPALEGVDAIAQRHQERHV